MFSNRTNWDLTLNKLSLLIEERKRKGLPIIDLTVSNPTKCRFDYSFFNLHDRFIKQENLTYNPDTRGLLQARLAVADYYLQKEIQIDPEKIFLTVSTSEAYSYIFRLLLNYGEEILVPKPSYPLLDYLAQINDVKINYYQLIYDGEWHIDFNSLNDNITNKTKAIALIHPNNPTGSFIKNYEYDNLIEIARKYNLAIISDEVFLDYTLFRDENRISSFTCKNDVLTFTLSGISKMLGLPQMKLSWIVLSGPSDVTRDAEKRLEIISDTYLSVSMPIQNAFPEWMGLFSKINGQINNRIRYNYNFLLDQIKPDIPISVLKVEGGWNVILKIPLMRQNETWVENLLNKSGIIVQPGYFYDFEDDRYIILSLLTIPDIFQDGIKAILETS